MRYKCYDILKSILLDLWRNRDIQEKNYKIKFCIFMKLVGSRKLTWGICSIGVLLAIVSVFFLPQIIPVHFANGIADDFGNKVEIFLFPILLLIITLLTGKENIKYFLTHSKTFLTDIQYNLMIDGVLGIILIAEIYVIYASFV